MANNIALGSDGIQNTQLMSSIIEYCKINNLSSIILLTDFEKAFDTVK